jgi:hypothetical protein
MVRDVKIVILPAILVSDHIIQNAVIATMDHSY